MESSDSSEEEERPGFSAYNSRFDESIEVKNAEEINSPIDMRYSSTQKIELNYKLSPYIPEFIPAVGDIDAFIKVPRPDGVVDKIGLIVLDEPCANQSDPAVLHLQLRSQSKSADPRKQTVIKRIQDPIAAVRLSNPMPDIDNLMQQWPSEIEDKLIQVQFNLSKLDCHLNDLIDIVCNLLDIPVKPQTRIESLHTLFTLFLEVKNMKDTNF